MWGIMSIKVIALYNTIKRTKQLTCVGKLAANKKILITFEYLNQLICLRFEIPYF